MNFERECEENIRALSHDPEVKRLSLEWIVATGKYRYAYNWRWAGTPIIQLPTDILIMQELIWRVRPTVIVETGVARGGSVIFAATQLALLDLADNGQVSLKSPGRRVIGIDIDIRTHNREAIEKHPFSSYVSLVEGSSIERSTWDKAAALISEKDVVMIVLDSNHTHAHVMKEIELYAPLVSRDSYLIVHDTAIESVPDSLFDKCDWGIGDNPMTATREFLDSNKQFEVDKFLSDKMQISSSPGGYLRRIR